VVVLLDAAVQEAGFGPPLDADAEPASACAKGGSASASASVNASAAAQLGVGGLEARARLLDPGSGVLMAVGGVTAVELSVCKPFCV
jgi:hypothetical protein